MRPIPGYYHTSPSSETEGEGTLVDPGISYLLSTLLCPFVHPRKSLKAKQPH